MKNLKSIAIFVLAAAVLSSCGGLNKMVKNSELVSYKVTPEVLEMHGGEVGYTVDVNYPAKYFNKKAIVTLTPVLKYEGGETTLEALVLQGEDVTENNKPISYETGGKGSTSGSFAYEDAMLRSELYFNAVAAIKDKTAELGDIKIADGVIATPNLVKTDPKVLFFGNNFKQITPKSYEADIKYIINRADVRASEVKKDEISKMGEVIKNTSEDERLELKGVEVSAYASPDGALDLNTKLSEQRKNSANKYLSGQLKKSKVEVADELISLLSTPEDWDGFKKLMEESNIQDKEMILRVLSMHSDPVVREQEIKNLSAAFEVIAEEILPQLRRSKFTVKMDHIGWSDEELNELWASNPDKLVLEELLYTATLTDDNKKKVAIYTKATQVSPKCLRAFNNLGAAQFNLGNMDEAKAAFAASKAIKDMDITNNNLGAVALKAGEVSAAKELFTASMAAGAEVNYNLGIVNIIEGNYESAVNYFGSTPSFNAALAQYLNKNGDAAWRTIVNLPEENAYRYYLIAVIAASQDKPEVVYENLNNALAACSKPQMLKDRAQNDLEFAKLWNEPAFKAIVE